MSKKYNTAVFDLDGTILDTLEDLKNACNNVLKECGFPTRSLEEVRSFVGNGIINLIRRAVPEGTEEETIQHAYHLFIPWYEKHCMDHTKPYEGIKEMIAALRSAGIATAVVSNKADTAVQKLCSQFFPGMFDAAAGEREGIQRKPAPDTVFAVMDHLRCSPENTVYIGDSEVDIQTAKNAGIPCISVAWGFRERAFLEEHGASVIVQSPYEILPFFCLAKPI